MDVEEWIRKNVRCCACGGSLRNSKHINGIILERKAKWKNNTWGNVIVGVSGYAIAIVCDECVKKRVEPKFAVEWSDDKKEVRYHPVDELEPMTDKEKSLLEMLQEGMVEKALAG